MAENQNKNNNILYAALVIAGILLLLIPFFIFDLGNSVNGTGHLTRFGLHVLAFAGALFAGSMFSTGITQVSGAGSSAVTMKAVAWTAAVVVGTTVTYNTVQYAAADKKIVVNKTVSLDTSSIASNELLADTVSVSKENIPVNGDSAITVVSENKEEGNNTNTNVASESNSSNTTSSNSTVKKNTTEQKNTSDPKSDTKTGTKEKTLPVTNTNTTQLSETCNSFQILHGSKQLDRKLGLSVFDPNKTIRFNNDCGCILKDATMSLSRGNNVLEQKTQTGNFINMHTFKDLQADDRLTVEIKQANCKDSKGLSFLYTFPKPILTIVLISDHREFETAAELKNKQKNPKEPIDNSTVKPTRKDKVEEEMNKYGN